MSARQLSQSSEAAVWSASGGALPDGPFAVVTVPALLSVGTVAWLLECSPRTVRRRITEGSLPAVIDHGRVMVRGDEFRAYVVSLERAGAAHTTRRTARRSAAGRYDFLS